jgi:hypothetical protein
MRNASNNLLVLSANLWLSILTYLVFLTSTKQTWGFLVMPGNRDTWPIEETEFEFPALWCTADGV